MPSHPRPVYVDATGSDVSGQGTTRRPFASIDRAITFLRTRAWAAGQTADQYVYLAPGDYWETDVSLTDADSGGNGFDVVFAGSGDPGEARLLGGRRLTGWTLHSGSIYKHAVSAPVYTLYENDIRLTQARSPALNPGVDYPCAFSPYFTSAGVADSKSVFQYDPLDVDPSTWRLVDTRIFCWSRVLNAATDWFTDVHGMFALDQVLKRYTFNENLKFFAKSGTFGARYFVQGPIELLSGAGQWTYSDGFVYVWPSGSIEDQEIVIPTTKRVVSLEGDDAATRASHITLDGLAIEVSDFHSWYQYGSDDSVLPYNYFDTPALFRQGNVYVENVDNITIRRCHIRNAGHAGLFLQGHVQDCTFENTWVEKTGTDGISANGPQPGDGDILKDNTWFNVKINNVGQLDGSANGFRLSQSSGNTYSHFDISQGPNRAIWIQGGFDIDAEDNYAHSNAGSYIAVADVCQDSGDRGAITMSFLSSPAGGGSANPPNTLNQVTVDGVNADPSMLNEAPNGMFFDNHSSGQTVSNMLVEDSQGDQLRYNDSDGATLTNTSYQQDGSPNPGFNPALMSPDIGLTDEWPF